MQHLVDDKYTVSDFIAELADYTNEELEVLLIELTAKYNRIKEQIQQDSQLKLKDKRGEVWKINADKSKAMTKLKRDITQAELDIGLDCNEITLPSTYNEKKAFKAAMDTMTEQELYSAVFLLRERAISIRQLMAYTKIERSECNTRSDDWKYRTKECFDITNALLQIAIQVMRKRFDSQYKI